MPASRGPASGGDVAAIRCRDLAAMTAFYRDIVGLEGVEGDHPTDAVLMRAGEAFAAPAIRVMLFVSEDEDEDADAWFHPAHRLSLTVADPEAIARAEAWFRANGLAPVKAELAWIGWQCLSIRDPEGNTVELVAPVRQRTVPAEASAGRG